MRWALAAATVTAEPGGHSCTTNGIGGAQSCKVIGLTNGVSYTFTARLSNSVGAGAVSPPSSAVTPQLQCFRLSPSKEGNGILAVSPANSPGCPALTFASGATVTLLATPSPGHTLAAWSGSLPGPSELQWHWQYTMPATAIKQKVTFARCHSLTVKLVGDGSALTELAPRASAGCPSGSYIGGDAFAVSVQGYSAVFTQFLVPFASTLNPAVFRMPEADSTLLVEVRACLKLSAMVKGGSVTATPSRSDSCAEGHYFNGTTVTLTATPPVGYDFHSWTGAATGTAATLEFVMPAGPASLRARIRTKTHSITPGAVYGQLSFTEMVLNNPAVAPYGFKHPMSVALDSVDNLYVADATLNRILVFPPDSTTPSRVIGQEDFLGELPNRGLPSGVAAASSLSSPAQIQTDKEDGLLVCDINNNRVLYFAPGAEAAMRVYGQNGNFTTTDVRGGAGGLHFPHGIALEYDAHGQVSGVYIADMNHNRVLYYPGTSTTASRVYGQPDFESVTATQLVRPACVALDSANGLWVSIIHEARILYYPAGSTVPTRVLGQPDLVTVTSLSGPSYPVASARSFTGPIGLTVDLADSLYVTDMQAHRVLFFEFDATEATQVWGQHGNFSQSLVNSRWDGALSQWVTGGVPTADTLATPYFGAAFDSQSRMFIPDLGNARVLRFDV